MNVAFNKKYENENDLIDIGGYKNMYFIGEVKNLFPARVACVKNCTNSDRDEYDCECKCGLRTAKLELIKSNGVSMDGLLTGTEVAGRGVTYALILIWLKLHR